MRPYLADAPDTISMSPSPVQAMRPQDFEVNRAWLAFRMNLLPLITGEGEFDVFVLQDAGSMLILKDVQSSFEEFSASASSKKRRRP